MTNFVYLACPHTHKDWIVRHRRWVAVNKAAGWLAVHHGYHVFSPISHSHPIAIETPELRYKTWEYWREFDTIFIERADMLVVLTLEGWRGSVGVTAEIELAQARRTPVKYIRPSRGRGLPTHRWHDGTDEASYV